MENVWRNCWFRQSIRTDTSNWLDRSSEESLLEGLASIHARFVGEVVISRPDLGGKHGDVIVKYTVLEWKGKRRLFAVNMESDYPFCRHNDVQKLYPFAREYWNLLFPEIVFPRLKGWKGYWIPWLHKQQEILAKLTAAQQ